MRFLAVINERNCVGINFCIFNNERKFVAFSGFILVIFGVSEYDFAVDKVNRYHKIAEYFVAENAMNG